MGPTRHSAGFTLIELMIVISIIGICLLAFTPSFIESMADRRAATATMELARMGRRARSDSIGHGRAYLAYIEYGAAGRFRLLRGNSTRCDVENWNVHANDCPTSADGARTALSSACPENVDLSSTHWLHEPFVITVGMWLAGETPTSMQPDGVVRRAASGRGLMSVCYEPGGAVRWSADALSTNPMVFSSMNAGAAAGGGLLFAVGLIDRTAGVQLVNQPRVVLFPLGTTPRRLR